MISLTSNISSSVVRQRLKQKKTLEFNYKIVFLIKNYVRIVFNGFELVYSLLNWEGIQKNEEKKSCLKNIEKYYNSIEQDKYLELNTFIEQKIKEKLEEWKQQTVHVQANPTENDGEQSSLIVSYQNQ